MHRKQWVSALVTLSLLAACAPAAQPFSDANSTPTVVTSAVGAPPTPTIRPASTHTPRPTPVTKDCADAPLPTVESPSGESGSARRWSELKAWSVQGADIPGLGGFYSGGGRGEGQSVTILMTNPTQQQAAEDAARRVLGEKRFAEITEVNVQKADYTLYDLARWYNCMRDIIWAFDELGSTDLDEKDNRIILDFRNRTGLKAEVETAITRSGIPLDAVHINISSCPGGVYQPPQPDPIDPDVAPLIGALAISVSAPSQVRQGKPVTFTMTIKNVSSAATTVEFGAGNDYVVTRTDGDKVWDLMCQTPYLPDILYALMLEPGQERGFTQEWSQIDNMGEPVAPGEYLLYAILDVRDGWASPPARITVLPD